jgi:GNAT superfamily N-acetyltransferase
MALRFPTDAERPDLRGAPSSLEGVWPEFLYHDPVSNRFFIDRVREHPELQFRVWDDERDEVVGRGNAIPALWDGDVDSLPDAGVDAVVEARFAEGGPGPNVLCALQIIVAPSRRGQGLSGGMIERMRELGREHGFETLIAPVRPTLKDRYPLAPIERYIEWRRSDGALFDPWLRTHERRGAEIVKIAPRSLRIPGTVADWEEWTQMAFPETGAYVVPGALVPVEIDRERDEGLYEEPNVWMVHS